MDEKFDQTFQQAAAFQKMWTDAFTHMADGWSHFTPGRPPPDTIREMRAGMLKVLTEAWDQFMRTPQFMEYMKTSTDGFMNMRKMAADAMTRGQHEMQSPAREDIDGVLLAIRHMERRLLDRVEDIETAVSGVARRLEKIEDIDAAVAALGRRLEKLEEQAAAPAPVTLPESPADASAPAAPRKPSRRAKP